MADSNFRGPLNSMGSLEDVNPTVTGTAVVSPIQVTDGPSMFYQGSGFPDIRTAPFTKDVLRPGQQQAFLNITDCFAVDNIPQAASSTTLAALQISTGLTNLALVTATPGGGAPFNGFSVCSIACGVPIVPAGTTVATTANIAIDFGFQTGTTVANSSTVVVADNTQFQPGQWIIIGGAGANSSKSLPTQVISVATANITGITIFPVAITAISNAPIGQANLYGATQLPPAASFGPATVTPTGHEPTVGAGFSKVLNPKETLARNIQVAFQTTTATTTVEIFGWDIWRNPMTESITIPSANRTSATSFFGAKAFKYISNIAISTTAVGSASVGLGDVFGLPMRADYFPQLEVYWNDSAVNFNSGGFKAAFTTAPSTATTADVRGTLQVSTNGTSTALSVQTAAVSNGTSRLVIIQNLGVWNTLTGNPNNTVPIFGIAQSTT